MFCCVVFCVLFIFAIILIGKRKLVVLPCLSSLCLTAVIILWLFLRVPWVGLQCVIVVFPEHTHLFFCKYQKILFLIIISSDLQTRYSNQKLPYDVVS